MDSPTLLLALRDLGRTDQKALIKSAVKELIARGILGTRTIESPRRFGARRPRLVLVAGPVPGPPADLFLAGIYNLVVAAPSELHEGQVVRDLAGVAKHIAKTPDIRRRTFNAAIEVLFAQGLVRGEQRKVLGLFTRTVQVRTPAGDALLARRGRRRTRAGDGGGGGWGYADSGSPASHHGTPDDDFDDGMDASFDGAFDGSFDSAFDSSFDSAFDSSFDSGFSSGDSGGGGGDGGGGGGGGD